MYPIRSVPFLGRHARSPYQWFNFFDFWKDEGAA